MGRPKKSCTQKTKSGNGTNLGFEEELWAATNKLRGHMDAAEYQHVALGLIFLKYISDIFQERYDTLEADPHADHEDRDEYTAENVFCVPLEARWDRLQESAKSPEIGETISTLIVDCQAMGGHLAAHAH
jgi:type I restriction enzyme M protein